ncbi:GNAT family N-acetyltransferase [Paenibacillus caui]|uniref:GNAT family N-acetyltransferase n=1 Tax=Paenibacillus caui TaxID=2873927 RepID=UPI001CA8B25A|nr:GNAT family N-acetyltransferase [Paenibacillus caui]
MEIRQLKPEEFEVSMNLSEYAFQYKLSPEARDKRRESFLPERFWGAFENGELQARLMLLPLQIYIQGKAFEMGGIAGVATWPEMRRKGLVSRLLFHALTKLNEQGRSISCLHPFSIPFYRKFGWEVYTDYKKYILPVDKFPAKTQAEGAVKRDIKDISLLDRVYHLFAKRYNGMLVRDASWWEQSVLDEEMHTAVYYSEAGEAEGYILYKCDKKKLDIDEFVFLNEMARRALWTYLANHDSMVAEAEVNNVPADDILPFLLDDPRFKQETVPYFMARIVNAGAFVREYPFSPSDSGMKASLQIQDEFAPWNDGLWSLEIAPDGTGNLLAGEETGQAEAGLICDIQTLTAMLLGYKRPVEMFRYGRLLGSERAALVLERMIPARPTALMDFF